VAALKADYSTLHEPWERLDAEMERRWQQAKEHEETRRLARNHRWRERKHQRLSEIDKFVTDWLTRPIRWYMPDADPWERLATHMSYRKPDSPENRAYRFYRILLRYKRRYARAPDVKALWDHFHQRREADPALLYAWER
jgi:hypothetical protein